MPSPFDRVVTAEFAVPTGWAIYKFKVGDTVEFVGQFEDVPGMVLIVTERQIGIWMSARELKEKSVWLSEQKTTKSSVATAES